MDLIAKGILSMLKSEFRKLTKNTCNAYQIKTKHIGSGTMVSQYLSL